MTETIETNGDYRLIEFDPSWFCIYKKTAKGFDSVGKRMTNRALAQKTFHIVSNGIQTGTVSKPDDIGKLSNWFEMSPYKHVRVEDGGKIAEFNPLYPYEGKTNTYLFMSDVAVWVPVEIPYRDGDQWKVCDINRNVMGLNLELPYFGITPERNTRILKTLINGKRSHMNSWMAMCLGKKSIWMSAGFPVKHSMIFILKQI